MKLFLFLTVLTFLGNSFAYDSPSSCTEIEIDKDRKKLGPVRNQTDIGWCYAYGASDMLSYFYSDDLKDLRERLGHGLDKHKRPSAVYTALAYNTSYIKKSNIFSNFEGGLGGSALRRIRRLNKFCLDDTEKESMKRSEGHKLHEKMVRLFQLRDLAINDSKAFDIEWSRLTSKRNSSIVSQLSKLRFQQLSYQEQGPDFAFIFANEICRGNFFYLPRPFKTHLKIKYISSLKEQALDKAHEAINWAKSFFSDEEESGEPETITKKYGLFEHIDAQLEKDNIVGISYFSDFLQKGFQNAKKKGAHFSTVVGRRWNSETKSCEYQVRNSWGDNCRAYPESVRGKNNSHCDRGYLWIPKSLLDPHLISLTYLSEK